MPKVKKIELSFVCDEDWNKMTPVPSGRHCASCEKTVVNFTGMSDAQIVAYYSQKQNEKSCGQFRKGQLEHINKGLSMPRRVENRSWFKPILASAVLASFGCEAQTTKPTKTEKITNEKEYGVPDKIGKVCVDTTTHETGEVEQKFEPRKITHVESIDTTERETQNIKAVVISSSIREKERQYHLGGVPAISYEETTRGQVYSKGDIEVTSDSTGTKVPWRKRLFKKKNK